MALAHLKILSNTRMTAGDALHLKQIARSTLYDVSADGQDGNGNLWNGVHFDATDQITWDTFQLGAQNDGLLANGSPGGVIGDSLFISNNKIAPANGTTMAHGIHIAGGFGGFQCGHGSSLIFAQNNVLIDEAVTPTANRQVFFEDGCWVDSARGTDNILINDPQSLGGFITINGWTATAVRYGINVQSWPGGNITIRSEVLNAGCWLHQRAGRQPLHSSLRHCAAAQLRHLWDHRAEPEGQCHLARADVWQPAGGFFPQPCHLVD